MIDKLILTLSLVNLLTNSAYSSIAPFYPLEAANKGINPVLIGKSKLQFCVKFWERSVNFAKISILISCISLTSSYTGFIFSVYSLTKSIVAPIVGQLMAKTGRKVMIFSGLMLEVISNSLIF